MRYMVLLKGDPASDSPPDPAGVAAMGAYIDELLGAGILLAAEGLQPSSAAARIRFSGTGQTVIDGPFAGPGELIAGYFLIEVRSRDEAIAWASRCPVDVALEDGQVADIEVRGVFEMSDAR
jgi:hypothetical protein